MTHEACRNCSAGLACVSGLARYYFRCERCREFFVQIPGGTIRIFQKATVEYALNCALTFANNKAKMDMYASDCCSMCAEHILRGRMAEHDTRSVP